jgi:hypothetical protein
MTITPFHDNDRESLDLRMADDPVRGCSVSWNAYSAQFRLMQNAKAPNGFLARAARS